MRSSAGRAQEYDVVLSETSSENRDGGFSYVLRRAFRIVFYLFSRAYCLVFYLFKNICFGHGLHASEIPAAHLLERGVEYVGYILLPDVRLLFPVADFYPNAVVGACDLSLRRRVIFVSR